MTTSPFSIFIKDLVTEYSVEKRSLKAVEGVDLQIKKGEVMGLAGESACGKSTLAYSILRLLPANGQITNGEIHLNGSYDSISTNIQGGKIYHKGKRIFPK